MKSRMVVSPYKPLAVAVLLLVALAGCRSRSACQDALGCVTVGPDDPIRLAYLLVTSGDNADLGLDTLRGIKIAIEDQGTLLNHTIELVGEDGGCNEVDGQAAAARLAADETIVAVIGPSCSSEAVGAAPVLSRAGLTLLSPSTTRSLPGAVGYLRLARDYLRQGRVAAHFAYEELGLRQVATLYDSDVYAETLQQEFARAFTELGGTVTGQEALYAESDLSQVLARLAAGHPQALYVPVAVAEEATLVGAYILEAARALPDLENTVLIASEALATSDFLLTAGDVAEGLYVTQPALVAGPDYEAFVDRYRAKYGEDPLHLFHAHAYDAAQLIFAAMGKVVVVEADGTLHIGRQALRAALLETQGFQGLTGTLSCDETSECGDDTTTLAQAQAGQYQVVCVYTSQCISPTPPAEAANRPTPTAAATLASTAAASPAVTPPPSSSGSTADLIVFASDRDGDWDIYVANADGTNPVNLTNNTTDDLSPVWSPDGQQIAYTTDQDGNWEIYVIGADGATPTNLTNHPAADQEPAWSPDGQLVAFTSNRDSNNEVYVTTRSAPSATNVSNHPASDQQPTWSPDGTQLAFISNRDGNGEVYVMDADGDDERRLTEGPTDEEAPAWSPDGTQIAFVSYRDGNAELYLMASDGANPTRLTDTLAWEWNPVWAAGGTQIIYESNEAGNWELYTRVVDGSADPQRLTSHGAADGWPAWLAGSLRPPLVSPPTPTAVSLITFSSDRDGDWDIYTMGTDGSNVLNLTNNDVPDYYSTWSPDGRRLAFVSERDGNAEIYVMNTDGSSQTRLTNDAAVDLLPVWSPDGRQIAFRSDRGGVEAIYVMQADGSGLERASAEVVNDWYVVRSPDEIQILFAAEGESNLDIYVSDPARSDARRLTDNQAIDDSPVWSPDGTRIAFHSDRNGNFEIYVMQADGIDQRNLTNHPADDRYPDW